MDISKASNFERFVFDLLGRDAARTRALFAEVETRRAFALDAGERARIAAFGFVTGSSTPPTGWRRSATCTPLRRDDRHAHRRRAEGRARARRAGVPMIVLETALPAKFAETIVEALGRDAPRPARLRRHRSPAAALHGDAGRRRAAEGLHRRK